jgi:hypothetical protein
MAQLPAMSTMEPGEAWRAGEGEQREWRPHRGRGPSRRAVRHRQAGGDLGRRGGGRHGWGRSRGGRAWANAGSGVSRGGGAQAGGALVRAGAAHGWASARTA